MIKCKFTEKKVEHPNDRVTLVALSGIIEIPEDLALAIPYDTRKWMKAKRSIETDGFLPTIHFKVRGKAVRSSDDINDPNKGERLAETRAKLKVHTYLYNLSDRLGTWLLTLYEQQVSPSAEKYVKLRIKSENHILDLKNK